MFFYNEAIYRLHPLLVFSNYSILLTLALFLKKKWFFFNKFF
jgi:hypothetical protein